MELAKNRVMRGGSGSGTELTYRFLPEIDNWPDEVGFRVVYAVCPK